jgi:preprotein translocase subunit SecD
VLEKLAEPTSLRASFIRAAGQPPLLVMPTREGAEAAVRTLAPRVRAGTTLALQRPLRDGAPWYVLLLGTVAASNDDVRDARASVEAGRPIVLVKLKRESAERFEAVSRRNVGRRLAITFDGAVLSAPYVTAPIPNGDVQITLGASGSRDEASTMALVMRAGAPLPVPLRLVEERRIPPGTQRAQ